MKMTLFERGKVTILYYSLHPCHWNSPNLFPVDDLGMADLKAAEETQSWLRRALRAVWCSLRHCFDREEKSETKPNVLAIFFRNYSKIATRQRESNAVLISF